MSGILLKGKLKILDRISPSKFTALNGCPLREIWSANNEARLLPLSPSAHLGTAVHKLIESASRGQIRDEAGMVACWEESNRNIENEMQSNYLEKHLVPLELNANNYEVKRNMAFNVTRTFFRGNIKSVATASEKKLESEVWVETEDGKIGGRIDLVKHVDERTEIFDYKTGAIIDSYSESDEIKQEYKQQLKLYAALYFSKFGVWPVRIALVGLDQHEYEIVFDKNECINILNDAKKKLCELNALIEGGSSSESFARPSPQNCRYCLYRPACQRYWDQRQDNDQWPLDVQGMIKEKKILGNGSCRIILENGSKRFVIRGLSSDRHLFLKEEFKEAMFCNLGHDSTGGFFIERLLTTGYGL
jgi:RecB family exonuclease